MVNEYEIKKLKQRIQELENDLMLVEKSDKKKIDINLVETIFIVKMLSNIRNG